MAAKISGFGGQGVLFLGVLLAEAGMRERLQVSWIPSYGPEMRGGTAHCHVRLSGSTIACPLVQRPSVVVALNAPSVIRFAPELLPGGLLLLNSSMSKDETQRSDIMVLGVPATEIAQQMGTPKVANLVLMGALLQKTRVLSLDSVLAVLRERAMASELLQQNRRALLAGMDYLTRVKTTT